MGLRKQHTIRRFADGAYIKGRWQKGVETQTLVIAASVQPIRNDERENLPEGKRMGRAVKIYTDALLRVDDNMGDALLRVDDNMGDVLLWLGTEYRIIAQARFQMGIISHYRYYAVSEQP